MKKILLAVLLIAGIAITEKTNAQVHIGVSIGVPVYHTLYRGVIMPPPRVIVAPAPRYYGYEYNRRPVVVVRDRRWHDHDEYRRW